MKACAAGLLHLGENGRYNKAVRPHIPKVLDFEKSLRSPCNLCRGAGSKQIQCKTCSGSGNCAGGFCRGGQVRQEGFDGQVRYRRCSHCKGSTRCKDCNGKTYLTKHCFTCGGKGGRFSPSTALARSREEIETALAGMDGLKRAEAARIAKIEHEKKMREAEIETQKEAMLVAAKAKGEEQARQAAIAAREAEERKRKAAEDEKYALSDQQYLRSVVVIEGDRSVGTGFLSIFKNKKVLISNAHVLCGNRRLRLRTLDGEDVDYTNIHVCKDRDIVIYEIKEKPNMVWLPIYENVGTMKNQEKIVVFGNSDGKGVVTTLRGNMQGIGPDKIEVSATFVGGNSGSPVIAYPYNSVVGMATFVTRNPNVDWTDRSTRFAEVRRFGVRVDNVDWSDFFELDGDEYTRALDAFEEIINFSNEEILKSKWQGRRYIPTASVREKARRLLQTYRATPEWMRQYAHDATLAAYICVIILE